MARTKKLIYRADSLGYTLAIDLGGLKAIDEGLITHADVMFDCPHSKEALCWLRERPWISIGWYNQFWESPVLPAEKVPHMVDEEGRFRWRHRHPEYMDAVPYEEAYSEFQAEYDLCLQLAGRPVVTSSLRRPVKNEFERAFRDFMDSHGIHYNIASSEDGSRRCDPRYENLKLISHNMSPLPIPEMYKLEHFRDYDYISIVKSARWEDPQVMMVAGHPGYVDDYILNESRNTLHRIAELQGIISDELKQWVLENRIELISYSDLIYGRNEYQDHLKEINSPLWVGNF